MLALAVLHDGSHRVSFRVGHGRIDLVLHHHDVASHDEVTVEAEDHPHGDHVIGRYSHDSSLAPRAATHASPTTASAVGGMDWQSPSGRSTIRAGRPVRAGPAPPAHTVILRI
jgi:hypothetical protein